MKLKMKNDSSFKTSDFVFQIELILILCPITLTLYFRVFSGQSRES